MLKEKDRSDEKGVHVMRDEDRENPLELPFDDPHSRERALLASEQAMEDEDLDPVLEINPEKLSEHRAGLKQDASAAP